MASCLVVLETGNLLVKDMVMRVSYREEYRTLNFR